MWILRHISPGAEATRLSGHFLAKIKSQNHAPGWLAQCGWVCDFLETRQIHGQFISFLSRVLARIRVVHLDKKWSEINSVVLQSLCTISVSSNLQDINDNIQLLEEHLIEFNQLAIKHSSGDEDILNRVMPKDNIALAAVFRTIVPNNGKFQKFNSQSPLLLSGYFLTIILNFPW